jgi:hypothetical protein
MKRARKTDILIWVAVKKTLSTFADMCVGLEQNEFARFREALLGELTALEPGGDLPEIWKQATASFVGLKSYGLERIGLWPSSPDS